MNKGLKYRSIALEACLAVLLGLCFGLQTSLAQNLPFAAVDDTMWTMPGYPVSINALQNDYNPNGDSIYILGPSDSIITFQSYYNSCYAEMDTIIIPYFLTNDSLIFYHIWDTGNVYVILDNPFYDFLDVNNINAQFNNFGHHFWELPGGDGAKFFAPNGSNKTSIYMNTLWIGGVDESDELHLSGELWRQDGIDFWRGPISDIYDSAYELKWNHVWKLNKLEVEYHKSHWWEAGYQPIQNIDTWPGNGDIELGQSEQIAPYYDNNNDGIYNPMNGDYPEIKGDQALFFVFNDVRDEHTSSDGLPLGIEIRAMAYAFNTPADSALWNTVFLNYKIVNCSDTVYHDTYIGSFTDIAIGNTWNDYVGCDVQGGFYFGYNAEDYDGNMHPDGFIIDHNYGDHPPAQAVMLLGGPYMDEDEIDNPKYDANNQQLCDYSINGLNFGDTIIDNERYGMTSFMVFGLGQSVTDWPQNPSEYYTYMQALWKDNSECLYGGMGHLLYEAVGPACTFMLPGDSDPCNWGTNGVIPNGGYNQNGFYWTMDQTISYGTDVTGLGSSGSFTFKPGDVQEVDLAFVWARDYEGDRLASVDRLKERCYYVKDKFEHEEDFFSNTEDHITSKTQMKVYPNPVNDKLTIQITQKIKQGNISVYNVNGKCLFHSELVNQNEITINTLHLNQGLYVVKLFDGLNNHTAKFIKK